MLRFLHRSLITQQVVGLQEAAAQFFDGHSLHFLDGSELLERSAVSSELRCDREGVPATLSPRPKSTRVPRGMFGDK